MPINNYNNDQISDLDKKKKKKSIFVNHFYALHELLTSNIYKTGDI